MRKFILTAALLAPVTVQAQPVQPLSGYACAMLNVPAEVMMRGALPPVLASPSASAPRLGTASAVVLVSTRRASLNGYAPVMHLDGREGWIEAAKIKPYRAEADPSATCTPIRRPDGKPGFR